MSVLVIGPERAELVKSQLMMAMGDVLRAIRCTDEDLSLRALTALYVGDVLEMVTATVETIDERARMQLTYDELASAFQVSNSTAQRLIRCIRKAGILRVADPETVTEHDRGRGNVYELGPTTIEALRRVRECMLC